MRIPVKLGRTFTEADNAQGPKVIIVNEALARRYWLGQNAVGKHILIGRQPAEFFVPLGALISKGQFLADCLKALFALARSWPRRQSQKTSRVVAIHGGPHGWPGQAGQRARD